MSSAILYLAIIAIWAGVLVPRWIHKPHRAAAAARAQAQGQEFSGVPVSVPLGADETSIGAPPAAEGDWTTRERTEHAAGDQGAEGTVPPPTAGLSAAGGPEDDSEPRMGEAELGRAAGEHGRVVAETVAWQRLTVRSYHTSAEDGSGRAADGQGRAGHARAHIVQARRRLLTMLVALMIAAVMLTVTGLSPWWVLVPTGGMLGMYLLLLREAANADAERAGWLAQERAARLSAEADRLRAREARAASVAEAQPTAEIIDISDRVGDQLYDQYADAAVRAVGD